MLSTSLPEEHSRERSSQWACCALVTFDEAGLQRGGGGAVHVSLGAYEGWKARKVGKSGWTR